MKLKTLTGTVFASLLALYGCDDSSSSSDSNGDSSSSGGSSDANLEAASTDSESPIAFDKSKDYLIESDLPDDFEYFYFENNPGVYTISVEDLDLDGVEGLYRINVRVQYYHEHNGRYQGLESYPAYHNYPGNGEAVAKFLLEEFTRIRVRLVLGHDGDDDDVTGTVAFRKSGEEAEIVDSAWSSDWAASVDRKRECLTGGTYSGGSPGVTSRVVGNDLFINRAWWPDATVDGDDLTFDREFEASFGDSRLTHEASGSGTVDDGDLKFTLEVREEFFEGEDRENFCDTEVEYVSR
ncbi:MAG: hypothetical protein LAT62_13905 [Natronospirillum sp.]|uniref:hypothetical protein n=1 Tax=Natronospirillum sp. TaxID=2812955 RepID=UPI0025D6EF9E|nr:hypothetical protein [Natronospirillum sp.]MCH8553026.1 hypothetical protein [Natronospirillum sp.]